MSTNASQPSPDGSNTSQQVGSGTSTPQQGTSGTPLQGSSITPEQGETTQFIVTVVEPPGQTLDDAARQRIQIALREAVEKELASEAQQTQGTGASDAPPEPVGGTVGIKILF